MLPSINYISNQIQHQFPSFYREEGQNFIAFVKAYYEFLEQEGYPIQLSRDLYELRDVDSTTEAQFSNFIKIHGWYT